MSSLQGNHGSLAIGGLKHCHESTLKAGCDGLICLARHIERGNSDPSRRGRLGPETALTLRTYM